MIFVEVYVDEKKTAYRTLGYKQFGWFSIIKALLSFISRTAISEVRERSPCTKMCNEFSDGFLGAYSL